MGFYLVDLRGFGEFKSFFILFFVDVLKTGSIFGPSTVLIRTGFSFKKKSKGYVGYHDERPWTSFSKQTVASCAPP